MKASLLAFMDIPQSGQVKSGPAAKTPLHSPVRQPGQRSSSGTPARALSMCLPHPAQVNFCRRRSGKRDVSCFDLAQKIEGTRYHTQTNDYRKPLGNTQTHIARRAGIFPAHLARDLFLIDCSAKCGVSLHEGNTCGAGVGGPRENQISPKTSE